MILFVLVKAQEGDAYRDSPSGESGEKGQTALAPLKSTLHVLFVLSQEPTLPSRLLGDVTGKEG